MSCNRSLSRNKKRPLLHVSELHEHLETAQADTSYRHHEGIEEISDDMDDTGTKADEAEADSE